MLTVLTLLALTLINVLLVVLSPSVTGTCRPHKQLFIEDAGKDPFRQHIFHQEMPSGTARFQNVLVGV